MGGSAGAVGSKLNIFNGSDTPNVLGITGADESSEYAAIGVNGGNAIITGGGVGSYSAGIVFRTAASGTEAERMRITANGEVRVGTAFTVGPAGVVTATSYHGDGSNLTGIAVGISTAAKVISGIVTTLDLSSAQDHKQTVSGIVTFTCSGGTEGDSHTIRIINSGITTVGFSTYFLFPSGSAPSLPTASGAISLISFTVNRVGAGAGVASTELLAGASVNFS